MRESMTLLKRYLSFEDYWIIAMFKHINLEVGNSYYEIDRETLTVLCEYLRSRDLQKLKQIWGEKSIQHDIFEFCEIAYRYFTEFPFATKKEFEESLSSKLKMSPIKDLLLSFYDELNHQYVLKVNSRDEHLNYSYTDEDFDIYYLKDVEKIELKEIYTNGDVFFYLVVDGIIEYNKKLISEQNMIVTLKKNKELKLVPFVNKASVMVFVVKKHFLNKLGINIEPADDRVYRIYNTSIFSMILSKKGSDRKNSQILFQVILYLLEKVKETRNEISNLELITYKTEIVNFIDNNYYMGEKELGESLLKKMDMSLSKLYKIFKFLFDTTPGKYIEKIKISKSYKQLVESNKSIEEIAYELGYSFKTFTRKFEIVTGHSPSKFRKMMRDM